jgi:putative Ca2+/H+ antiporter (TMEM165/GDT1 family)
MEAFLVSTGLVAVAEIGDKTQLLALCLAASWRRPLPIILGILVATVANHLLAGALGALAGQWLEGPWMRWILGLAFLGFAVWALIPDQFDDCPPDQKRSGWSVFLATTTAFFLVEMGDKTQVATAALAAQFTAIGAVVAGSTLGMMIANVPAVLVGEAASTRLPLIWIRRAAAALFAGVGVWILVTG